MSWFAGIISNLATTIAAALLKLLNSMNLYDIIKNNMMARVAPFGHATFADMFSFSGKGLAAETLFSNAFSFFAWTFFLMSIYFGAMGILSAPVSGVQKTRFTDGLKSVVIAAMLISVGQYFAMAIAQVFYWLSLYFLQLGGAKSLGAAASAHAGAGDILLPLLWIGEALLSIIVWVIYQFRALFLDVWMAFFPLAMAFYAHEKTRGIAKMWWTEWIYQMAIPFGQAVVLGFAVALGSGNGNLTLKDFFDALAGVVGLLGTAVYVRRLIDTVAQAFGAAGLGHSSGEMVGNALMMGAGLGAGDMMGKGAVRAGAWGTRQTAGKAVGALGRGVDNTVGKALHRRVLNWAPEGQAAAIAGGASLDDVLNHQENLRDNKPDAFAGGPGVASMQGARSGLGTGGTSGGGRTDRHKQAHRRHPFFQTRTGAELQDAFRFERSRNAIGNSHLAAGLRTWRGGMTNSGKTPGGLVGSVINRTTGGKEQRAAKKEALGSLREHLHSASEGNARSSRVANVARSFGEDGLYNFQPTTAQVRYSKARDSLVQKLQNEGLTKDEAHKTVQEYEQRWNGDRKGVAYPLLGHYTPTTELAYTQAHAAFRPAREDTKTIAAVRDHKLAPPKPVKDPLDNLHRQTGSLLDDLRTRGRYVKKSPPKTPTGFA
ncbi:MAG: hypothetical protein ACYCYO_00140 [Bacilli bacterium]